MAIATYTAVLTITRPSEPVTTSSRMFQNASNCQSSGFQRGRGLARIMSYPPNATAAMA